jgi:hypothetical protein
MLAFAFGCLAAMLVVTALVRVVAALVFSF